MSVDNSFLSSGVTANPLYNTANGSHSMSSNPHYNMTGSRSIMSIPTGDGGYELIPADKNTNMHPQMAETPMTSTNEDSGPYRALNRNTEQSALRGKMQNACCDEFGCTQACFHCITQAVHINNYEMIGHSLLGSWYEANG